MRKDAIAAEAASPKREALAAEIRRLGPWHHDVEVEGLSTYAAAASERYDPAFGVPTRLDPFEHLSGLVGELFPGGLAGRAFLDCACNAGGYVLAARKLGAGRGFGFDARAHWIRQAAFLTDALGVDGVAFGTFDLAALSGQQLEPFDVTLFKGIFYHLPDPVAGLRAAADLTRELIILNTAIIDGDGVSLRATPESQTEIMSGMDGLAWYPTGEPVLRQILAWCGFPHTRLRYRTQRRDGRNRLEMLAARDAATFADYDRLRPEPATSRPPLARRLATSVRRRLRL